MASCHTFRLVTLSSIYTPYDVLSLAKWLNQTDDMAIVNTGNRGRCTYCRTQFQMAVFWVIAPCSLVEVYQRFRGPCCLHHQATHRQLHNFHLRYGDDDDQWRYSPDRALASLTGFMMVCSTMWVYQFHDRPVLDTLIQPSETSSSNYHRHSWRSRETRVRNGR
jgi:hypothetical protein